MNEHRSSLSSTWIVGLFILALVPAALLAQEATSPVALNGRIFQPDGATPYPNVVVRVINQETGQEFTSAPTDAGGHYAFQELPPGAYRFEVEVDNGIYQLDRTVRISEGEVATISFNVKPDEGEKKGGAPLPHGKKRAGIIIPIAVGGAVLLAVALNDDDNDEASPFTPMP
ncbi:MAG: carboxypeptidase-like regulatory domain-containing protein [Acidobacteriota bacterium]